MTENDIKTWPRERVEREYRDAKRAIDEDCYGVRDVRMEQACARELDRRDELEND